MDNISHSLSGLLAGEIIHRSLPAESDSKNQILRRRLLLVGCAVASNFPDLDLVLTPLLPQPLGYLLHHRGHTHTILYAIPQALLLFALLWTLWPSARNLLKNSTTSRLGIGLALFTGFALHLCMDYLNSYGIHPFHPLDSRWFYGDMVFIIEPLFWVAFGIPMAMTIQNRWFKRASILFLFGFPVLFTYAKFLPLSAFAVLTVISISLGIFQYRAGEKKVYALIAGVMIAIAFIVLQGFASGAALRAVQNALTQQNSVNRFLDSALTSLPTNPICWRFVSIEMNESENTYQLKKGIVSLAPQLYPISKCPNLIPEEQTPVEIQPGVGIFETATRNLEQIRQLTQENCNFNAWMRFTRAPDITQAGASDMRFQRRGERGDFTYFKFDDFKNQACPKMVPGWAMPRADLLQAN